MLSSISEEETGHQGSAMNQVLAESGDDGVFVRPDNRVHTIPAIRTRNENASLLIPAQTQGQENEQDDAPASALVTPALVESLGTAAFVFVGLLSVWNSRNGEQPFGEPILVVALAHGLALFVLISSTAHVSGGHFNPAVSLGVFLAGRMGFVRMVSYWTAQVFGSIFGAGLVLAVLGQDHLSAMSYGVHNPQMIVVNGTSQQVITSAKAMGLELVATSVLLLAVLTAPHHAAPLHIGMAVTTGILTIGGQTGGSMNPARSFGPLLISINALSLEKYSNETLYFDVFWKRHWIYWAGPLLGAIVASIVLRLLSPTEKKLHIRIKVQ